MSGLGDQTKVAAARVFAVSRYPYLASAVFACELHWAPSTSTIAVDRRWRVHADPAIVDELETQDLGRLLVHLTGHLLRDHAVRAQSAGVSESQGDPAAWNLATDAEVNDDLEVDAMVPPVAPALPASFGRANGDLAESYYPEVTGAIRRWDCGSGCDSAPRGWDGTPGRPGLRDRDIAMLKLAVAAAVQHQQRTQPGTVTGGWLRWAEQLLPSKVDWRRVLAAEIRAGVHRARGMVDYSYRRPSRRAGTSPAVILPALERPVPHVAVVCDTSGSMSGELLSQALAEVESLLTRTGLSSPSCRATAPSTRCSARVGPVPFSSSAVAAPTWERGSPPPRPFAPDQASSSSSPTVSPPGPRNGRGAPG